MADSYQDDPHQLVEIQTNQPRYPVVVPTGESRNASAGARGAAVAPTDVVTLYTSIFWHRRILILGLAVLGIIAGLAIALTETPYYRARASVELDSVNDMYLSIRDASPEADSSQTDTYMQTQAKILASDMVVRRTLEKNRSLDQAPPRRGLKERWLTRLGITGLIQKTRLKHVTPTPFDDGGVGRVMQHLDVRPVPLTRIIEVTYDDTDPYAAASFTNALINEYIAMSMERRLTTTQSTEQWLAAYVSNLKGNLEQSGRTLESYAHASGLVGTSEDDTPAEAKLRDLQTELSKAHADRISKQALYDTVAKGPREGISPSMNPSPLREYQAKLSDLRSEWAQAIATLTPAHYKVQRLEAQIHEMEQLIDKEWQKTLALILSDYQAAVLREKLLGDSVQAQMGLVADQAGQRVHYDVLRRELETNQQVYNTMLQKEKELAVLGATKPTNIHLVNQAVPATLPFAPNVPIYASMGGLSGLFASLLVAAYCERREKNLFAPGILTEVTSIRELGVIPTMDRAMIEHNSGSESREQGRGSLMRAPVSSFLFLEAFHSTVVSILRAECNGLLPRVITISSAISGEGKTTVTTNLGLALARIHRRVVLIDGDLRHPKLSKNFDIANSWGLSDILQSTNPIEDMPFEALVKPTGKPGLYVMPSGPAVVSVSSLLQSRRMGALIETLRKQADLILIDSPPLLAVSDARVLGSASDAVILVIRAHKTGRETFQIAAQHLIDDRTPLLGTILNDWDPRRARGMRDPFQYQYAYRQ